jgi:hypothetical protein
MKSIHAISTILAVWGMAAPGAMANRPSRPAPTGRFDEKGSQGLEQIGGRTIPAQSAFGMPNLLAAALLQGGSRTDRRCR